MFSCNFLRVDGVLYGPNDWRTVRVNMDLNLLSVPNDLDVSGRPTGLDVPGVPVRLATHDTSRLEVGFLGRGVDVSDSRTQVAREPIYLLVIRGRASGRAQRYTIIPTPFPVDCFADIERRKQRVTIH